MHTLLKLAALALPFTTAFSHRSRTSDRNLHARALTDIVTSATDIAAQVNAAVGDIIPIPIDSASLLDSTLDNIRQQAFEIDTLYTTFAGLLQAIVADTAPTDITDALNQIAQLVNGTDSTVANAAQLILNGLATTDLTQNVLASVLSDINSFNNVNPSPLDNIYPQKASGDAPYSVPEANLRAAIYIPPGFTYGVKRPVLFVPGTGAYGGVNFISNLGKLLAADGRFDPVYLNVPGAMLDDTQTNSEYIAYAINYLGSITGTSANANNLAVIPWSQGNLDTQWVLQYWPSTRSVVTDFISASADFHGTTIAYFLDPAVVNPPLPPSVIQQEYDSNFVLALRYGGGGSPYVNSTSVHSIFDEIVQPQYSPYASADYFTQDLPGTPDTTSICPVLQNVPYTNNEVQRICAGQPAGGIYTHEGVLYNPLMYALTIDALTHDGPGRIERLDLATICAQAVAPGLTLADVLATEGLIPLALINILLYPNKVTDEPAVRQYALQANTQCTTSTTSTTFTSTTASASTSTSTATMTTTTDSTTSSSTASYTSTSTGTTTSSSASTVATTSSMSIMTSTSGTTTSTTSSSTLSSSTTTSSATTPTTTGSLSSTSVDTTISSSTSTSTTTGPVTTSTSSGSSSTITLTATSTAVTSSTTTSTALTSSSASTATSSRTISTTTSTSSTLTTTSIKSSRPGSDTSTTTTLDSLISTTPPYGSPRPSTLTTTSSGNLTTTTPSWSHPTRPESSQASGETTGSGGSSNTKTTTDAPSISNENSTTTSLNNDHPFSTTTPTSVGDETVTVTTTTTRTMTADCGCDGTITGSAESTASSISTGAGTSSQGWGQW